MSIISSNLGILYTFFYNAISSIFFNNEVEYQEYEA